ncbi:MAG TPA: signal peptidase II [Gemmatimonadaceae bacterium]|nr:signal peptidase II [Gemmatimonadaceae bacterium]
MRKHRLFWPLLLTLVLADCTTKRMAVEHLTPPHVPHEVIGDAVRFTLAYNPGAAFSLSLGPHSRWAFTVLTLIVLGVLAWLYGRTRPNDRWQAVALACVSGGATGNLLDRLRSSRGVVDFIDLGIGAARFWTFNLADVAVTTGAVLLAIRLLREEREMEAARRALPGDPERA